MSSVAPSQTAAAADLTPAAIRALRGTESRAAFARRLGVTPHTVYRWELPDGAEEARRPRAEVRMRLVQLAGGAQAGAGPGTKPVLPSAPARAAADAFSSPAAREPDHDPEALSAAVAAFAQLMQGEWRAAEPALLRAAMAGGEISEDAAAVGSAGLAFAEVALRCDARAALSALAAAIAAAGRDRLSPGVAATVYGVAALAHALPDGRFFDLGRVHAYQARVEALALRGGGGDARLMAGLAAGWAAVVSGDNDLLLRAFDGLDPVVAHGPPPLLALMADEALAFRSLLFGRSADAAARMEVLARQSAALGAQLIEARVLASIAQRQLEDLGAPERVRELTQRSRELAQAVRAAPGLHTVFEGRAEAEALFRLGRLDEAHASLATLELFWRDTGVPPSAAIPAQIRILQMRNDVEGMKALAARLRACTIAGVDRLALALAASVDASLALVSEGIDAAAALRAFDRAEQEGARWPFLLRDVVTYRPVIFVMDPDLQGAEAALRRAQRVLDGFPSPWASAHLRRAEGMILATRGYAAEARRLLEASLAIFAAAGCKPDVVMAKLGLALLALCQGDANAPAALAEGEQAMRDFGATAPAAFRRAVAAIRSRPPRALVSAPLSEGEGAPLEPLTVALQRLLVPGATAPLVQRELISVTESLFPGRTPRLEEIDSNRGTHDLGGSAPAAGEMTWAEFGDSAGHRFRIGVAGPLGAHDSVLLSVIALGAGAALQIASLRGLTAGRTERAIEEEGSTLLPGFIAASPVMRRLRSDLARFAGSRSTVIVTGESGSGKEVVARAIHDLSSRAGRPYVVFNCAAVPRELFEGQLFGHRKGAFTGAHADHPGVIRAADGGTLFLDEIGELPLDLQPKLLRFLENGEIAPLGERRPVTVDVRTIAATHRDLEALVRERRFREDLFFRLQVIPLRVPPLRERREDVGALARHFLRELAPKGRTPVLAPDALAALSAQSWPGNVRELRNVIERSLAFAPEAAVLTAADLRLA
jgi:predicted ATP-dependent protease